MNYNMHKLERHQILGGDGKSMVWVYDGDVEYAKTSGKNYKYYYDSSGKRNKTRPYAQWSSMTNRCLENGSHKRINKSYEDVKLSPEFSDFDFWMNWAVEQQGFMCLDNKGRLFQLDKDLLGDGKLYSRKNCCFLPAEINCMLNKIDRCRETYYIDRQSGFELKGCSTVYSYEFLPIVSMLNARRWWKDVLDEYFEFFDDEVLERLIDLISKTKYDCVEKEFMSGKIICLDYKPNFKVISKRNLSCGECYGYTLGYKGKIEYTYKACGYDWCAIVFNQKSPSFSDNINLEVYSTILRLLATEWYLTNEVLCDESRKILQDSFDVLSLFYKSFSEYQIEYVRDYGTVSEFIDKSKSRVKEICGGFNLETTWFSP